MGRVEGEVLVNRPVDEVFDFVADGRNEPRFNPRMLRAELLSAEPIGSGSRFLTQSRMLRRTVETEVEFTAFERPRLLGSRSRSVTAGRKTGPMTTEGSLSFDPMADGTRVPKPSKTTRRLPWRNLCSTTPIRRCRGRREHSRGTS